MKQPIKIFKSEHFIPYEHGMSNDEMFKSMISKIITNENFDLDEINNLKRVFLCRKICFKGDHVGYSKLEKVSDWFIYKDHQNRYSSTSLFTVEYVQMM